MEKLVYLIIIVSLLGCKKEELKPEQTVQPKTAEFHISSYCNFPGAGGNQLEYSINGGDTTIVNFLNGITIDSTLTTGDTYYVKSSSLDYSQEITLQVNFDGALLESSNCVRNSSTPDNCSVTLTGTIQ